MNTLEQESIKKLLLKYSIPGIISILVSAMYNIVDQIFIGQSIGLLGNAATNVAFPLTTICTAIALLLGVGGATNFNLSLGANKKEKAAHMLGTSITLLAISGIVLSIIVIIFLSPLLRLFGATQSVYTYAKIYTSITTLGFPFLIFATGCSPLIRADGSPKYSMYCVLVGAILNCILDPIFIFTFNLGIAGAAWATVISQIISFIFVFKYLLNMKIIKMSKTYLKPKLKYIKSIFALGSAACLNQISMTFLQIVMNNILRHYGALSIYGAEIPLATVGVVSKINIVLLAFTLGISQGCQPIFSYNYGAKRYDRVKEAFKYSALAIVGISIFFQLLFIFIPREIISIFGEGTENYYIFAQKYFRIFLALTFFNGFLPLSGNFFTAIGKAKLGVFTSLTRQIIFLIPLIIILPIFIGIDGVMYAGPIADVITAFLLYFLLTREFKNMTKLQENLENNS